MPDNDHAFFGRDRDPSPVDAPTGETAIPWRYGEPQSGLPESTPSYTLIRDPGVRPPWTNSRTIGLYVHNWPGSGEETLRCSTDIIVSLWNEGAIGSVRPNRFIVLLTTGVQLLPELGLTYSTVFDVVNPIYTEANHPDPDGPIRAEASQPVIFTRDPEDDRTIYLPDPPGDWVLGPDLVGPEADTTLSPARLIALDALRAARLTEEQERTLIRILREQLDSFTRPELPVVRSRWDVVGEDF